MPILDDLKASGIDPDNRAEVLSFISRLAIPRDRREGLFRLYCSATSTQPALQEIELVRARPSP